VQGDFVPIEFAQNLSCSFVPEPAFVARLPDSLALCLQKDGDFDGLHGVIFAQTCFRAKAEHAALLGHKTRCRAAPLSQDACLK
jgi:hypothetical protein